MDTVRKIIHNKSIKTILDLTPVKCRCYSDEFGYKLVKQFHRILAEEGPYIIQCDAGKKRTGFASIILEMLSGTNYELIAKDYIESYVNNNGLDATTDFNEVEKIKNRKVNEIIRYVGETEKDIAEIDFVCSAKAYLLRYGFSEHEILQLLKKLE